MPKRCKDRLYDKYMCDFGYMIESYYKTDKNKRNTREKQDFRLNYDEKLIKLHNNIVNKTWKPHEYRDYKIFSCHKERSIESPRFEDRIIHTMAVEVLESIVIKKLIDNTYSCIKNRGIHKASNAFQSLINQYNKDGYVLKCDIHHYFESINHSILMNIWKDYIADKDMLNLIEMISIRPINIEKGHSIPIGSRVSQLNANVYLSQFDHYIVEELRVGKRYIRYADDFVIVSDSKEELKLLKIKIEEYLNNKLSLRLNPKSNIIKISKGIDFVGYRTFVKYKLFRKSIIHSAKYRIKKDCKLNNFIKAKRRLAAFKGYIKHCRGYIFYFNMISKYIDDKENI